MSNEDLYQKALDAITELFGDDSVDADKAEENLRALKDEIDVMIDSII